MKLDVVLGLQWGDEGKGKVVDVLTPSYNVISRFQGGPNAGHTLIFNGEKYVLHTIPSGIFRDGVVNIIGGGVVIDPVILVGEIAKLRESGKKIDSSNLKIAKKAHLILPTHRILDAASEKAKGDAKIGSTLKGIGPTYMDKTGRNGLRVGDTVSPNFMAKYDALKAKHTGLINGYNFEFDVTEYETEWFAAVEKLKEFDIIEGEHYVNTALSNEKAILAEGAQGSLLDIDFGTYPFVTSSNTVCAGVCTGLGVAPTKIGRVYGIFKAYCTRVGSGPFPTELFDEVGEKMAVEGKEFGSTTGRRRRCGWLDMVALKYSVMINGATDLIMMKCDVLDSFETIKIATSYKIDGKEVSDFPYEFDGHNVEPVYTELKGWNCSLTGIEKYEDFPKELKEYVEFIEKETGVKISIVSIGPDRKETIIRS
ncbi:MAG: adenylosuccinate synthase [Rikenellaceae bacterium]